MVAANIKATFQCDVQRVWSIVTSLDNYSWRSDLSKIEILSESKFVEYTKDGHATTFTITATEPCQRWEFDMDSKNITGHWIGLFSQTGAVTTIDFTEYVAVKKFWLKPFLKRYLKKQQALYVADLEKALLCQSECTCK